MVDWFSPQHIVWKRQIAFKKMGMKESYMILYNGWLTMDNVVTSKAYFNEHFLTNEFLG